MISIEYINDGFGDVIYKKESIGIKEPDGIVRLHTTLEDCMNDEKTFDEIVQFRKDLPEIRQAVIGFGYKLEKEIEGTKDVDEESVEDLRSQYDDCF